MAPASTIAPASAPVYGSSVWAAGPGCSPVLAGSAVGAGAGASGVAGAGGGGRLGAAALRLALVLAGERVLVLLVPGALAERRSGRGERSCRGERDQAAAGDRHAAHHSDRFSARAGKGDRPRPAPGSAAPAP